MGSWRVFQIKDMRIGCEVGRESRVCLHHRQQPIVLACRVSLKRRARSRIAESCAHVLDFGVFPKNVPLSRREREPFCPFRRSLCYERRDRGIRRGANQFAEYSYILGGTPPKQILPIADPMVLLPSC